jgi:transcriptional regulator with XRE-family HTH domain
MNNAVLTRIDQLLEERGMSRRELARRADVNEQAVATMFFRDALPTGKMIVGLCRALNVSADYLFFGDLRFKLIRDPSIGTFLHTLGELSSSQREAVYMTVDGLLADRGWGKYKQPVAANDH